MTRQIMKVEFNCGKGKIKHNGIVIVMEESMLIPNGWNNTIGENIPQWLEIPLKNLKIFE